MSSSATSRAALVGGGLGFVVVAAVDDAFGDDIPWGLPDDDRTTT